MRRHTTPQQKNAESQRSDRPLDGTATPHFFDILCNLGERVPPNYKPCRAQNLRNMELRAVNLG